MDATLSTLESEASSMNAQMTMANVMVKNYSNFSTIKSNGLFDLLTFSNLSISFLLLQMPLENFQKTMQMFEQNMTANNIKQEMMNDAMDAAFEGDDDEEER